ncbi:unnamed protein product [Mytilus edulis]|uniref:Uncharacterized protein n=1 Tax=Mytilus edulis TaxID=6550 RepID=A0A8S3U0M2_MYTED|nr:unnamed protein product [Mytilus edulis]
MDKGIGKKSTTLDQTTVDRERQSIETVANYDLNQPDCFSETNQINKFHTEVNPVPDREKRTLEEKDTEKIASSNTMALEICIAPESINLDSLTKIETTDLEISSTPEDKNLETTDLNTMVTSEVTQEASTTSAILSAESAGHSNILKRRHIPENVDQEHEKSPINTQIAEENDESKKKPHFERRRMFNLAKHIISIVLIILDLVFDWMEYSEMNKTGNYTIAADRSVKDVEFTIECEGTGKTIQFIFLTFIIVATILSVVQILHIIYQLYNEIKGNPKDTKINLEYVETFVFLFFIEISQIMLIMGFYDVCTLDCTMDLTDLLIALNGLFSFSKVSWRFFTSCKCCTVYRKNPIRQHLRPVPRSPIRTVSPRQIVRRERDCRRSCSEYIKTCLKIILLPFIVLLIPFSPCILVYYIAKNCKCDCDVCESKVGDQKRARNKRQCEQSFKCCILRCCPDQDTQACDCKCEQCLSCNQSCKCCILGCFPAKFECKCRECLICDRNCYAFAIPCTTTPPQPTPPAVISIQPMPQPRPIVIQERKQQCENCGGKCINFLAAILILFVIVLLLFYLFLLVVEIQFVFDCVEQEWLMLATQESIVQNYLKLFSVSSF